jgi:ParB family chromosome partitioning protein
MKHARIEISSIKRSDSARATNPSVIESLAASMNQIGLLQPITVTPSQIFDGVMKNGYRLIAGNHRFLSAEKLGWTEIDAIIVDGSSLESELIEIDENLCRAELTPAQRAAHIKRRKQIWEALHPTEKGGKTIPTPGGEQKVGFASDTASISGETKRSINQHISRADALGDDINEVVGTSLDKGVELDALKKLPEPERKELIERAKAGEQVSARPYNKITEAKGRFDAAHIAWFAKAVSGLERRIIETCGATIDDMVSHIQDRIDVIDPAVLDQIAEAEQDLYALYQLTQTIRESQGAAA